MSNRYKTPKVHLLGPVTGGGFSRTLCEHYVTPLMQTSEDSEKVTCQVCSERIVKRLPGFSPC
jgi:hypothetical protein